MSPEEVKKLSHDFKNALNGVAVNLEVLSTRVSNNDDSLALFVKNASEQLEKLTALSKTLLTLVKK